METQKFPRNLKNAMSAPLSAGVLRFYRGRNLIAVKDSQNIQADLFLVSADWSSPLRQATEVTYEIF